MSKSFKNMIKKIPLPKALFLSSLCVLSFFYGFFSLLFKWFPYSLIKNAVLDIYQITKDYSVETEYTTTITAYNASSVNNGLSLVISLIEDKKISARIINMDGEPVHEWLIDWFDLWPDVTHIPKTDPYYPKSRPGTFIHGALLLENGDLIFNFEYLGMVRIDVCGNVVWRLPYRTHHSIHLDDYGNLWVPGLVRHENPLPNFPNQEPPFYEETVLKVSLKGEILDEISVFELLKENNLEGLLYLSSFGDQIVNEKEDPLHLNDVETFPLSMNEGVFKSGDIMISLRNINTVLVFREEDLKVTHYFTGNFIRQHDPDFIDGNTISVYDNYRFFPDDDNNQSRILIQSITDGESVIYYSGTNQDPFYSNIMGKHQWLPNGNLLVTESTKGRAFEIDQQGNKVWEFINLIGNGKAGLVTDVNRLPDSFSEDFFHQITEYCKTKPND